MGCLLLALSPEVGAMTYRQAPMLEEAVRRGELPPLAERLPPEPMVVEPAHEIGRYGGTWHQMMRGSSDFHAYSRCVYEQMVRWRTTEGGGLEVGRGSCAAGSSPTPTWPGIPSFEQKANDFNPERPVMSAWRVVEWKPGSHLLAERNPYYWKVDPAGNQLPYLDRIRMEIFLNRR